MIRVFRVLRRVPDRGVGGLHPASIPRQITGLCIDVDNRPTSFEVCRFEGGYWAAIGRVVDADVTITSFGVPLKRWHSSD
jgi:hypothetical protein